MATPDELAAACDVIGAQFSPPITAEDRRFTDLARRFNGDQPMMLVVCTPIVEGGALAFRSDNGDTTLRIIGLAPHLRRRGLGRRLVERIVEEATGLGSPSITVGGVTPDVRGFYERVGFHGRKSIMRRELPLRRLP